MNFTEFKLYFLGEVYLIRVKVAIASRAASVFAVPEMRFGENRTLKMDAFSFAQILFEIVVVCQS
jgi:hypothetical protein